MKLRSLTARCGSTGETPPDKVAVSLAFITLLCILYVSPVMGVQPPREPSLISSHAHVRISHWVGWWLTGPRRCTSGNSRKSLEWLTRTDKAEEGRGQRCMRNRILHPSWISWWRTCFFCKTNRINPEWDKTVNRRQIRKGSWCLGFVSEDVNNTKVKILYLCCFGLLPLQRRLCLVCVCLLVR